MSERRVQSRGVVLRSASFPRKHRSATAAAAAADAADAADAGRLWAGSGGAGGEKLRAVRRGAHVQVGRVDELPRGAGQREDDAERAVVRARDRADLAELGSSVGIGRVDGHATSADDLDDGGASGGLAVRVSDGCEAAITVEDLRNLGDQHFETP